MIPRLAEVPLGKVLKKVQTNKAVCNRKYVVQLRHNIFFIYLKMFGTKVHI